MSEQRELFEVRQKLILHRPRRNRRQTTSDFQAKVAALAEVYKPLEVNHVELNRARRIRHGADRY